MHTAAPTKSNADTEAEKLRTSQDYRRVASANLWPLPRVTLTNLDREHTGALRPPSQGSRGGPTGPALQHTFSAIVSGHVLGTRPFYAFPSFLGDFRIESRAGRNALGGTGRLCCRCALRLGLTPQFLASRTCSVEACTTNQASRVKQEAQVRGVRGSCPAVVRPSHHPCPEEAHALTTPGGHAAPHDIVK